MFKCAIQCRIRQFGPNCDKILGWTIDSVFNWSLIPVANLIEGNGGTIDPILFQNLMI